MNRDGFDGVYVLFIHLENENEKSTTDEYCIMYYRGAPGSNPYSRGLQTPQGVSLHFASGNEEEKNYRKKVLKVLCDG